MEPIWSHNSLVLHNGNHLGKFNDGNNHFPEALNKQYENQLAHLQEEVRFLREQLQQKNNI
ncbi:hypothetical protein [Maribacter sp. 2307ULW6-5]|uniref:hypothetical protein n=1 Tax=Maribacter sp. 2307ULW6-5 TaxID=3386275 RepID=UPI0039BC388A